MIKLDTDKHQAALHSLWNLKEALAKGDWTALESTRAELQFRGGGFSAEQDGAIEKVLELSGRWGRVWIELPRRQFRMRLNELFIRFKRTPSACLGRPADSRPPSGRRHLGAYPFVVVTAVLTQRAVRAARNADGGEVVKGRPVDGGKFRFNVLPILHAVRFFLNFCV